MREHSRTEQRLVIRHRRNMRKLVKGALISAVLLAFFLWYEEFDQAWVVFPVIIGALGYGVFAWVDQEEYVFDRKARRATLKLDSVLGSRKVLVPLASIDPEVDTDSDGDWTINLTRDKRHVIPLRQKLESEAQAKRCSALIRDFVRSPGA
jgi:hypothetical protein